MQIHGEPNRIYGGETPEPVTVETNSFVEDLRVELKPFQGTYQPGKSRRPF
jgi:hypothetical protein